MTKLYQSGLHGFGMLLATLLLSTGVYAGDIQVEGAWTQATDPGRDFASVFMFITSKQDATLVGASSPAAKTTGMHTMEHKHGMMRMFEVKSISLPANKRMDMTSIHSYHLKLTGLKAPLKAGTTVPLMLDIETADKRKVKVDVQAEVRPQKSTTKMNMK